MKKDQEKEQISKKEPEEGVEKYDMQIQINQNRKELKQHGSYDFPVHFSRESIQNYEQGRFLWHWHPEIELTLILSGEIEYHINDATYLLKAGDGLFGNSNTLHAGFQRNDSPCTYLSLTFLPRFLYGYEGSVIQTKYVDQLTENENCASLKLEKEISWQAQILSMLKELFLLSENETVDFELQIQILLLQIWQKLYAWSCTLPASSRKARKNIQRLRDLLSYLQEHSTEELSLDQIAGQINICKSECCRFFKKYMNMTIFDYLLLLRIQNALPLLQQGESITHTAEAVGFSNTAYFGQIFKRYMNCTPSEYRSQNRKSL